MNNTIIISILIAVAIIFIVSLFFLFRKKEKEIASTNTLTENQPEESTIEEFVQPDLEIIIDKKLDEKPIETIKIKPEAIVEEQTIVEVSEPVKETIEQPKVSISISSKTEKILLNKLQEFEDSKGFIKKDVNLNNLAKKFETNTKYLSEIIKTYKNKNFNNYLNDLRINHLINELKTNEKVLNTKVSYLASDFGFSSHSSFSTIFTQYIGQTPSEYIKNLKKEKAENSNP